MSNTTEKEKRHTCTVCKKKRAESLMETISGYNYVTRYGPKVAGRGYVWKCKTCKL